MNTAATTADARPAIRTITPTTSMPRSRAGWADFRAAPRFGLFFGGVYALLGIAIFLQLWVLEQPFWIVPFAFAFPLIGPFAAIGLYEVSRRRETGEPLDWAEILGVIWTQRDSQIPSMAFIVLAGFMIWMWVASMLVILFLGRMSLATYSDLGGILNSGNGLVLIMVGTVLGGGDRLPALRASPRSRCRCCSTATLDYVTAMVTSYQAVTDEPAADAALGLDRRGAAVRGDAAAVPRARRGPASARPRHLAPLPPGDRAGVRLTAAKAPPGGGACRLPPISAALIAGAASRAGSPLLGLAERIVLALHRALEMGAALDRDRLVDDVALAAGRGAQPHLQAAQPTDDAAVHHHLLGDHLALDRRALADDQHLGADVALDDALDLDVAAGAYVAVDGEVGGEHRRGGLRLRRREPAPGGGLGLEEA